METGRMAVAEQGRGRMQGYWKAALAVLAVSAVSAGPLDLAAQEQKEQKKPPAANPVGAGPPPWKGEVSRDAVAIPLDEKQTAAVQKVSGYFNELLNLKGSFLQTSADNKRMKGKFYVKPPGRFRFDYAPPSKQVIIADGRFLRIQDLDLGNEEAYDIDNTPFRLLLRKDVELIRDASILEVQDSESVIVVTLQDKNPDVSGRIKLVLGKRPTLELKEWVTTDAQGLETHVALSDVVRSEEIDPAIFKAENLAIRKMQ